MLYVHLCLLSAVPSALARCVGNRRISAQIQRGFKIEAYTLSRDVRRVGMLPMMKVTLEAAQLQAVDAQQRLQTRQLVRSEQQQMVRYLNSARVSTGVPAVASVTVGQHLNVRV